MLTCNTDVRPGFDGVAGFFEDIPVLAIILVGVGALVSTGVGVAKDEAAERSQEYLEAQSERLLSCIMSEIGRRSQGLLPSAIILRNLNMTECASALHEGVCWAVSIVELHPQVVFWISVVGDACGRVTATGYSAALMNACLEDGLVGIFEVRVLVWRA